MVLIMRYVFRPLGYHDGALGAGLGDGSILHKSLRRSEDGLGIDASRPTCIFPRWPSVQQNRAAKCGDTVQGAGQLMGMYGPSCYQLASPVREKGVRVWGYSAVRTHRLC